MELSAPAKVNLSLRVLRRRDDGFHEIESLVAPLTLHDTLTLTPRESGGLDFVCDDPSLPTDGTNLVVRAVELFARTTGRAPHLRIALTKRIPHGAGLGGGSSDAASTLLGLDAIYATKLGLPALSTLAAEIGSDVPLFLHRSAAFVRGRGEIVEATHFPQTLPLLLVKPPFGVPTPWAYQRWRDSIEIPGVSYAAQTFPWGELVNDLERPVFEKYVFLAHLKRWLLAQPEVAGALMSGSGATVFALVPEAGTRPALADRLAHEFGPGLWCRATETVATPA